MKILLLAIICFLAFNNIVAQGGKAEPKRIKFDAGKSSSTLTGTLANGVEMEYVFSATEGQTVTIRNSKTSLFDFRVFNEEHGVETEFESSATLSLVIPATGDYFLFVRKKQVRTPRTARFAVTLAIK
ncbi:MAG: hypothetical protein WKF34_06690 [Pyrinomonadaceae bacterium]